MSNYPVRRRIAHTALILTIAAIISRFLGYMRDAVLYAQFGQNRITDVYQAAFSVPDFFYIVLVGGALSSAFIPVFSSYLATDREEEAWYVASCIFNLIFVILLTVIFLGMIFTPQLVGILVPGFDAASIALTVQLTRIMFVQTLFLGLAGIMIGILNSYQRFSGNALSAVLYNIPVLLVGFFLFLRPDLLARPTQSITYYCYGVVAGAVLSLLVQLPYLIKNGLRYRLVLDLGHPGVRQFGFLVFPVLISQSVAYFNTFVTQNLASGLASGDLAALRLALRIMQIPLGLFALAIGTAIFPTMTEQAARKEWDKLRNSVAMGIKATNFLTIPAAVGLVVLGLPLTQLLFEFGQFSAQNSVLTSGALFFYSFGIIGYSAEIMLIRTFYAIKDTTTPVLVTIVMIFLNILMSIWLVKPMGLNGLALAYSLAGVFETAALLLILRIKTGQVGGMSILVSGTKTIFASLLMGLVSYYCLHLIQNLLGTATKLSQLAAVGGGIMTGLIVYFVITYMLRMEEADLAWGMVGRIFNSPH